MPNFDWQDMVNKSIKLPQVTKDEAETEDSPEVTAAVEAFIKLKPSEMLGLMAGMLIAFSQRLQGEGYTGYAIIFDQSGRLAVMISNAYRSAGY